MPHTIKKDGKTNILCSSLCCCLQTVRQMDRKRRSKRRKCWKCERSGAFQWHLCGFGVLFCCLNVCARITCTLEIRTYFAICLRDSLSFPPLSTVIRFNVPKLVVRIVNVFCMCSCVNARNRFLHFNWNTNTRLNAINTSHIVNVLLNPTGIFSVNYVLFVKTKTQTNTCRLSFGRRLLCRYFGFFVFATIDFISFIFSIFAARH